MHKTILDDAQKKIMNLRKWNAVPMQVKLAAAWILPTAGIGLAFYASFLLSDDPHHWYWSFAMDNPGLYFFVWEVALMFGMCCYMLYLLYETKHLKLYSVYGVRKEYLFGFVGLGVAMVVYGLSGFMNESTSVTRETSTLFRLYIAVFAVRT